MFTAHELSTSALVDLLKRGQLQAIKDLLAELYLQEKGVAVLNRVETSRALAKQIPDQMMIAIAQDREKYMAISGKALEQSLGELLTTFKQEVFALWSRPTRPATKPFQSKTEPRNPFSKKTRS